MKLEIDGTAIELAKGSYVQRGNRIVHKDLGILEIVEEAKVPRERGNTHAKKSDYHYEQMKKHATRAKWHAARTIHHDHMAATNRGEHARTAEELEEAKQMKMAG